jgi:BirA family biotin operon repressor/biotin-[acetyl-CoA-carboxylase] ligase
MTLTQERLHIVLAPRAFQFYAQADSTNDLAMAWLKQGAPDGAVVIADEQLKGRGRMGRTWYTPPGVALAVSVILHPAVDALSQVSMLGALAIAELCDHLGLSDVGIKWPNDVQVNHLKVSGVLPEVVWEGTSLKGVVLGMGINVHVDFSNTELAQTAINLESALGHSLDRTELLAYLLNRVDYWTGQLGSYVLYTAWKSRLNMLGSFVNVSNTDVTLQGVAQDVDEQGALLVRTPDGELNRVIAGDIVMG